MLLHVVVHSSFAQLLLPLREEELLLTGVVLMNEAKLVLVSVKKQNKTSEMKRTHESNTEHHEVLDLVLPNLGSVVGHGIDACNERVMGTCHVTIDI